MSAIRVSQDTVRMHARKRERRSLNAPPPSDDVLWRSPGAGHDAVIFPGPAQPQTQPAEATGDVPDRSIRRVIRHDFGKERVTQ